MSKQIRLSDPLDCVYDPISLTIYDIVVDGRTAYGGKDAAEYAQSKGARIWDLDAAIDHKEQMISTLPKPIDRDAFIEALEVLPPEDWTRINDTESFKMCERTSGAITAIYCRIGDRYFSFQDRFTMSHAAIVQHCQRVA